MYREIVSLKCQDGQERRTGSEEGEAFLERFMSDSDCIVVRGSRLPTA